MTAYALRIGSSATADWQTRAAAALAAGEAMGRGAVAYDFSEQPANGGDWKWGSLSASPKVTCEARNRTYDTPQANLPDHARDLTVYPPGSSGSLRFTVPQGVANAGDEWRFGIDDYDKQFREGDEFWVCWRTRLNSTAATHRFKRTSNDTNEDGTLNTSSTWDGAYTDSKHSFWGYGMQTPKGPGQEATTGTYYGYSPGASQSDNVMASCRTDVRGEIVMILYSDLAIPGPGTVIKYPQMYVGKPGVYPLQTRGQNINYFTERNGGDETTGNNTGIAKACEWVDPGGGLGQQYTDYSTCFIYPTDEWFSLMEHVILGQQGTAIQGNTGTSITGYINSVVEYYGAYAGQPWTLLHKRTLHIATDANYPGGQGVARFGMFGWTSYMTAKWRYESHPDSIYWISQIILQPGPTMPAAPV